MTLTALALAMSAVLSGHIVALKDGTALRVTDLPRVEGRLAILRLEDGSLVSVPVERIDAERTEAANRREREAEEAVQARERAARDRAATAPADGPRKRGETPWITNRTLADFVSTVPPLPVPSSGELSALTELAPSALAPPRPREPEVDDQGNPPSYWHEQARELRRAVLDAERELRSAQDALQEEEQRILFGRTVAAPGLGFSLTYHGPGYIDAYAGNDSRLAYLHDRVRAAQDEVARLRDREAELRNEARLAGAPAGWLRVPVVYR